MSNGAAPDNTTVLVACSHGTRDTGGQRAVASILEGVRARRPRLDVVPAFVDVQEPAVAQVVASVTSSGRRAVVVPLLLSPGFHTKVDIARAVESAAGAAVATAPLGPDERLTNLLSARLLQAGAAEDDAVVLAAAGSSEPQAAAAVRAAAEALRRTRKGAVEVGYGATASPSVQEAVAGLRAAGHRRVVVAAYLLAPGHFHTRLARAGADVVTAPLAPDDVLVDVVLDRFDGALGGWEPRVR